MEEFISTIKEHKMKFIGFFILTIVLVLLTCLSFKSYKEMSTVADMHPNREEKEDGYNFWYPIKKFIMLVQDKPDDFI